MAATRLPGRRKALGLLALGAVAGLLTACGRKSARGKLTPLAADAVVLAFGDSLTFGTGANPQEAYPAVLSGLIKRRVVGSGVPGEVSADGLARLPGVLDEVQPRLLLLCHGGNDFLRKLDDTQAAANVRAIIPLARERGAQVLLVGVPKPGIVPSPAEFYADIAKEFGIPYEDGILKSILTDSRLKSDLVHPNARGYERFAQAIAELMKKEGAV